MKVMKLGLVLGRFQPPHPGHLAILEQAFRDNDEVVVCIGSAQKAEPFSVKERHDYLDRQLKLLYPNARWRIVDLIDPEPMEIWPKYVMEKCEIKAETVNSFYRADELPPNYREDLVKLGFSVVMVPRGQFYYRAPDGLYYQVSSATEIKEIHKKLGQPLELHH